jgi:hypothetical protein
MNSNNKFMFVINNPKGTHLWLFSKNKIENREFDGKKWEWRGRESKKNFYFVWLKLKIETKMRKGKYASKISSPQGVFVVVIVW